MTLAESIYVEIVTEQACKRGLIERKHHAWAAQVAIEAAQVWRHANVEEDLDYLMGEGGERKGG